MRVCVFTWNNITAVNTRSERLIANRAPQTSLADRSVLRTQFLQKQQEPKIRGSYKKPAPRPSPGWEHGCTQWVSDGDRHTRQGDGFGKGSNLFFPQPATPPAFFPPTDWSSSLALSPTSYPSSSLSTKSNPICSPSNQRWPFCVSPSFMDTPKSPAAFSTDCHWLNTPT